MDAPVILKISGSVVVVGVGKNERSLGNGATNGDGKQEILIVDHAVSVAVLVGEVLDELDRSGLENAEVEIGTDALELAAKMNVVFAVHPIHGVIPLRALLAGLLRHTIGRAVGHAGEVEFGSGGDWGRGVDEVVEAVAGAIDQSGADDARPGGLKGLEV